MINDLILSKLENEKMSNITGNREKKKNQIIKLEMQLSVKKGMGEMKDHISEVCFNVSNAL